MRDADLLRCSTCRRMLPDAEFFKSNGRGSAARRGRGYRCRTCTNEQKRERNKRPEVKAQTAAAYRRRKAADPQKEIAASRRSAIKRTLGLEYEEYFELRQSITACEICGTTEPTGKNGFVVDHQHGVVGVRGFLCDACNRGLGFFRDDPDRLEAAVRYLRSRPGARVD